MRTDHAILVLVLFSCKSQSTQQVQTATSKKGTDGIQQIVQVKGATLSVPYQTTGAASQLTGTARASGIVGVSQIYDFGPTGTKFDPPATLTIKLTASDTVSAIGARLALRMRTEHGRLYPIPFLIRQRER